MAAYRLTETRTCDQCGCLYTPRYPKQRLCSNRCRRADKRKHGLTKSREYQAWWKARERCHNPGDRAFGRYGGRGIAMCDAWRADFMAFYREVGQKPSAKHSLDRIDNQRGYEPGNVRWATLLMQQRNTRQNRLVTFRGETLCLAEWSQRLGIKHETLASRLTRLSWTVERAFTTPARIRISHGHAL